MEPTYSRDECVAAFRDYYAFLASMFMDPTFIIEPPADGWAEITPEVMSDLCKTDEVIDLLRHLPYIRQENNSNQPQGLPGNWFIDWGYTATQMKKGEAHAGNELIMSEGYGNRFSGKIPADCIGLVNGRSREDEDWDVILLDVKYGIIHWMNCPKSVQETASPQSREAMENEEESHELEQGKHEKTVSGNFSGENKNGKADHESAQKAGDINRGEDHQDQRENKDGAKEEYGGSEGNETDEDEDEDEDDEQGEDYDLEWGPSWRVCDFFEMLKNQFRMLNFMPTGPYDVIDIWNDPKIWIERVPENIQARVQSIYRDHGWPDAEKFDKKSCLARIKAS